jgi:hypothetical protein
MRKLLELLSNPMNVGQAALNQSTLPIQAAKPIEMDGKHAMSRRQAK